MASSHVEGDQEKSVLRTSGSGCFLALADRRRESRVSPAAATGTEVGGSSGANLGAGKVVEGGERLVLTRSVLTKVFIEHHPFTLLRVLERV
jgi:hypothetical protein